MGPLAEAKPPATPVLGQVLVKGNAKINGVPTPSGATVFSGDQVQTEANSIAELALSNDAKVMLPGSSLITLGNDGAQVVVNLNHGALAALSKSPLPAFIDANGARIKPATHVAVVLEIAIQGSILKVIARKGSATVETADKTLSVEEGKELDARLVPPPPQGPAGAQPRSPFKSKLATYELIAAVGAGVTGLILGIIAISRSNPASCKVATPTGTITCP
jgi:hypothetical protein